MYLGHLSLKKGRRERKQKHIGGFGGGARDSSLCLGFCFILILGWGFFGGERKSSNARKKMETNFEIQPQLLLFLLSSLPSITLQEKAVYFKSFPACSILIKAGFLQLAQRAGTLSCACSP